MEAVVISTKYAVIETVCAWFSSLILKSYMWRRKPWVPASFPKA